MQQGVEREEKQVTEAGPEEVPTTGILKTLCNRNHKRLQMSAILGTLPVVYACIASSCLLRA